MSNSPLEPPLPLGSGPQDDPLAGRGPVRRVGLATGAGVGVAAALAGAAIAHFAWSGGSPAQTPQPAASPSRSAGATTSVSVAATAARVDSGLVDINTTLGGAGAAAGTGMVVSASGLVITNNHVIDGATSITATDIGNGHTYRARVVGYDQTKDVAVIQLIGAGNLTTVRLGNSSTVHVGQAVVTVGNAGGAGGTPSAASGTVTALGRSITASDSSSGSSEQLSGLIQLDGSLEPGDSGGPLVNSTGEVVGMDTAASSGFAFQAGAGEGFAIPINEVEAVARQIERGVSTAAIHTGATALIGVEVGPYYGYGFGYGSQTQGVPVAAVVSGTPAAAVGIQAGDEITRFGGRAITSPTALTKAKDRYHPGDRVSITWLDGNGNTHTATISLANGPAD